VITLFFRSSLCTDLWGPWVCRQWPPIPFGPDSPSTPLCFHSHGLTERSHHRHSIFSRSICLPMPTTELAYHQACRCLRSLCHHLLNLYHRDAKGMSLNSFPILKIYGGGKSRDFLCRLSKFAQCRLLKTFEPGKSVVKQHICPLCEI